MSLEDSDLRSWRRGLGLRSRFGFRLSLRQVSLRKPSEFAARGVKTVPEDVDQVLGELGPLEGFEILRRFAERITESCLDLGIQHLEETVGSSVDDWLSGVFWNLGNEARELCQALIDLVCSWADGVL